MPRQDPPHRQVLHIGHSPDPDDAFMWWPLVGVRGEGPAFDTGRFRFETVAEDIDALNRRAIAEATGDRGDPGTDSRRLDVTAMSCGTWPFVQRDWKVTACGASLGDGYGPKLVARREAIVRPEALVEPGRRVLVPGLRTSAAMALRLRTGGRSLDLVAVPFDEIPARTAAGEADAGLVIHESQLTFESEGLALVEDLGAWWHGETGLPLPLGLNCIRADLDERHGPGTTAEVTGLLRASIDHALAHRETSLDYALGFARGMDPALADRFVEMYVNRWTLDFGVDGRSAVASFLDRLADLDLVPRATPEFVAGPCGDGAVR